MVTEAPPFWWAGPDWKAWSLSPLSFLYGQAAAFRMRHAPRTPVDRPVICVGNLTVGGAGKTPTALSLARAVVADGRRPGFLSRGYAGTLGGASLVDPEHHLAREVGDEPLLLAEVAPTVVSPNRLKGAELLIEKDVDIILMDDGFQSARIAFDSAVLVVDSRRGLGNGHILPAGPVRAPVSEQIRYATGIVVVGKGQAADSVIRIAGRAAKPVFEARLVPQKPDAFRDMAVLAYAAIGDPGKFFASLEEAGARIEAERSFADHQHLSDEQIEDLLETAEKMNLQLVTTSKDLVRLRGLKGAAGELEKKSMVLEVQLEFDLPDAARTIIETARTNFRKRKL